MPTKNEEAIKQILESCKYMVDESIRKGPFDKTVPGRIISSGTVHNTYVVEIYGKQYTLPKYINNTLTENNIVKVTIPEGNMNYAFISAIFGGEEKGEDSGGGGGADYQIGPGLKLENNVLSVDTVDQVLKDNTKPVTSGAVYMELGNVEALLASI